MTRTKEAGKKKVENRTELNPPPLLVPHLNTPDPQQKCDCRTENHDVSGERKRRTSGPRGVDHSGGVRAPGRPVPVLELRGRRDGVRGKGLRFAGEKKTSHSLALRIHVCFGVSSLGSRTTCPDKNCVRYGVWFFITLL